MMNLGITNLTNPYLWSSFGPYAWMSDYGYEMQMNILPSSMPRYMAELAHGVMSPNHVSQWNPLFSIPIQGYNTNPFLTQAGLESAAKYGENLMAQAMDGMDFNQNTQTLSAISGQCDGLIKDEKLNDEQKAKLKAVQDKAKALQEELKEYKTEMQKEDSDKTALREKLGKISKDVKALEKEYVEIVKAIKAELEAAAKDEDPAAKKEDPAAKEGDPAAKDEDPVAKEGDPAAKEGDPAAKKEDPAAKGVQFSAKYNQTQYVTSQNAQTVGAKLAQELYDSIDGCGTDEEILDNAMKSITKDNVMEVLDAWNKTQAIRFGGESLLESIYGDIFWGDDREKYTRILMDALAAKAKDAGVDISSEYDQLNKELDAWWRDDDKIYELINTIHKNLGGKEYKA